MTPQTEAELRAELRQDYLKFWLQIAAKKPQATIHCYKNTTVAGALAGIDATQTYCNVNSLQTPIGVYNEATLRVSDIQQIVLNRS
ncbi:Gem associated protein-like protein 7 [Obelidium mucronatum]|nr:Gem associated protein-like protein 7 [Obelidium mucronatum]